MTLTSLANIASKRPRKVDLATFERDAEAGVISAVLQISPSAR